MADATSHALVDPAASLYPQDLSSRLMDWVARTDVDAVLAKAGVNRLALYTVRSDSEVRQCLETREDAVAAVPWRIEPANDPLAKQLMVELAPWWDRIIRGIFSAVPFGYSAVQLAVNLPGTTATAAGSPPIDNGPGVTPLLTGALEQPFEEFKITNSGEWRYFPATGAGGAEGLSVSPLDTIITVRRPTGRYPYGDALLSSLYWPVFFKREGLTAWLKFVERFGTPILLGKVFNPTGFVETMNASGFETAFGVSTEEDVQALMASHGGELERMQEQLIRVIQRVILGQTLTSDVGGSGSYAAAKVHDLVRAYKRNADVRLIKSSLQAWINRIVIALNHATPLLLVMADDTGLEADRAARDGLLLPLLTASGFCLSKDYFTDRYDLRATDLDDAIEKAPVNIAGVPNAGDPGMNPPEKPVPSMPDPPHNESDHVRN